jgi:hypothetical protein
LTQLPDKLPNRADPEIVISLLVILPGVYFTSLSDLLVFQGKPQAPAEPLYFSERQLAPNEIISEPKNGKGVVAPSPEAIDVDIG